MNRAISDTGPILHLTEIGQTIVLNIFSSIFVPEAVVAELRRYDIKIEKIKTCSQISVVKISKEQKDKHRQKIAQHDIHLTDMDVFSLALDKNLKFPVLTDDLALRQHLEGEKCQVIGSVGLLVGGYHKRLLKRKELEIAVDNLIDKSTLYLSRAFKTYVINLINKFDEN